MAANNAVNSLFLFAKLKFCVCTLKTLEHVIREYDVSPVFVKLDLLLKLMTSVALCCIVVYC